MVLRIFDATETIAFAKRIAKEIQESFPNTPVPATPKTLRKGHRRLDQIVGEVQGFFRETKPNLYKKAKFLNTVKWELKEAGREVQFIEEIIRLLANTTS